MRRRESDWPLVTGIAASAFLHAGVVWSSIQAAERGWLSKPLPALQQTSAKLTYEPDPPPPAPPKGEEPPPPLPMPEPESEDTIRLGIDESNVDTETWIGVRPEDAGEAQGRLSQIEQAAYARPAGNPDLPLIAAPTPELPPTPNEEPAPSSPITTPSEATDAPAGLPAAPLANESASDTKPPDEPLEEPAEEQPAQEERHPAPETTPEDFTPLVIVPVPEAAALVPETTPETSATPPISRPDDAPVGLPPPPSAPVVPPAAAPGGIVEEQFPGEITDRESEATAIREALVVEPGKPVAGKGLQVKTIRPRWSHFTLLTATPRDAVVRVSFNRLGKVEDVEFLQDTGRPDVDRPLLDAVYNWTASGKELEKLAPPVEGKPVETVKLVFRLILRGR